MKASVMAAASAPVLAIALLAMPASAQEAPGNFEEIVPEPGNEGGSIAADIAPSGSDEDIVVTGSRLRSGLAAPTPVVSTSASDLSTSSPRQISDALNLLPVFKGSSSSSNSTNSSNRDNGASFLNLRGLGKERTLVLLDGRRMVGSTAAGAPDIGLIPQDLVQRVEVVTGGASAAYGSDAVAGVVNFILDNRFEGLRLTAQKGISDYGDAGLTRVALTGGSQFAGDAGRIIASGEYFRQDGIRGFPTGRPITDGLYGISPSGGTNPSRVIVPDNLFSAPQGGLINSGPLAGLRFLPDGSLVRYDPGTNRDGSRQSGGDGTAVEGDLTTDIERFSGFARAEYQPGAVKFFAEGLVSQSTASYGYLPNNQSTVTGNAITIYRGNPFLPTAVANSAFGTGDSFTFSNIGGSTGYMSVKARSRTWRVLGGFEWDLGKGWLVSGNYIHAENHYRSQTFDMTRSRNLYAALDAAVDPATGQIVCRSTLSGFDAGCTPINIFGGNPLTDAQKGYITGTAQVDYRATQDVASLSINGTAFALPGGDVEIAAGIDYRREKGESRSDAVSINPVPTAGLRGLPASLARGFPGGWLYNQPLPYDGKYEIVEGFAEANLPVFKDSALGHSLSMNGAIRVIHYSTAGTVTTWKAGTVYEPTADLRLRATISRDIRAANILELFAAPQALSATVNYGGSSVFAFAVRSGNRDLAPEKADTYTAGIVYRPSWISGLGLSIDYYSIKVKGAIAMLTAQQTVDQCSLGVAIACAQIELTPTVLTIRTPSLNLASLKTSGVDLELDYQRPLGNGRVRARALGSYLHELVTSLPAGVPLDRAGDLGTVGAPKWQATFTLGYEADSGFGINVQERYIGAGKVDSTFAPTVLGEANNVKATFYTDLSIQQTVEVGDRRIRLIGTVNNMFNQNPRITPVAIGGPYRSTNGQLYDLIGRYFSVGATVSF